MDVGEETRLFELREKVKPGADVIVLNGAPVSEDRTLLEKDRVVYIKRGSIPGQEELKTAMAARHTPGVHKKVNGAVVGIAGLGGLGSSVAVALARLGVGRLIMVDFDVVEPSNLNRQQYFIDQIGWFKTEALQKNIKKINPFIQVETHNLRLTAGNIGGVFFDVDILVEALDTVEGKAMLVESFSGNFEGKPVVMASGLAGYYLNNDIQTARIGKNLYVVGDLVHGAQEGVGLMSPRVGIAAHHQANMVLRLIMGMEE